MKDKHPQGDLAPRDIVAIEIFKQMKESNSPHVWLDTTKIKDFAERFPTIFASCIENGIDPRKQMIPVSPASHYSSGGVKVDLAGRTSIPGLYACGETACTGAHGANRLASNSLLEGLVFGTRISADIAAKIAEQSVPSEKTTAEFLLDPAIKMTLQLAMSQGAGVMRSAQSLNETLKTLKQLSTHTSNKPCIEAWEVSNLYLLATAIAQAALKREETRGSHWRSDFPESSNNWVKRIVQSYDNDGIWLSKLDEVKK
jgi:L-aspartate oxidase